MDFLHKKFNVNPSQLLEFLWTALASESSQAQGSATIRARKESRKLEKQLEELDRFLTAAEDLEKLNQEHGIPLDRRAEDLLRQNYRALCGAICGPVIRSNPAVWRPKRWSEKKTGTAIAMFALGWVEKHSGHLYFQRSASILNASFRVAGRKRRFTARSLGKLWSGSKRIAGNKHFGSPRWILDPKPKKR